MNVKNYDIQNELLSDTLEICQDILAQFKYSVNALQGDYYTDKYDITLPTNISPFMEAYDDILVGWNLPISIQVQTPLNRCIAPFNYWDITPSPTPTNTATPTNTPSTTPTNTPTITPSSTPNRCLTYSGTSYGLCCFPISYVNCSGTTISNYVNYFNGATFCARAGSIQNSYSGTPGTNLFIEIGTC